MLFQVANSVTTRPHCLKAVTRDLFTSAASWLKTSKQNKLHFVELNTFSWDLSILFCLIWLTSPHPQVSAEGFFSQETFVEAARPVRMDFLRTFPVHTFLTLPVADFLTRQQRPPNMGLVWITVCPQNALQNLSNTSRPRE